MKTEQAKKLKLHKTVSILITLLGLALLIYMIIVEDEPGALPLLMIVSGAGWYFFTRSRIKSQYR